MAHFLAVILAAQSVAAVVVTDPIPYVDQLIGTSNGGRWSEQRHDYSLGMMF